MKQVQQKKLNIQRKGRPVAGGQRPTFTERGYGWKWSKPGGPRDQIMLRDCYLCQECARHGYDQTARVADHIIPADVRPDWIFELNNGQGLCQACHQQKSSRDKVKYGSREDAVSNRLTASQRMARRDAQQMAVPPRAGEVSE